MDDDSAPESEDIDDLYEWIVDHHSRWRETKDEIKKELLGEARGSEDEVTPRIRNAVDTEKDHDELLQSTISVFDPRGRVCEQTGWRVLTSEPLVEMGLPNADALIGHLEKNWAILVECKTGLSKPGVALEQIFDAAEEVRENRDYLRERTGLEIENIDCVLCVPSEMDWRAADTIEDYERQGKAREQVYIWRLNRFTGEVLQLYENIETREGSETSHNHGLTNLLSGDGIRIGGESEVTPEFFPSSHFANIIQAAFSDVLWGRERAEDPVTKFTQEELTEALTSQNNLLHYSADSIGRRIRDEMIPRLLDYGLIKPYENDTPTEELLADEGWRDIKVFEYSVEGRTTETVLANLREDYFDSEVEERAEEMARERTVERFQDESGSFDEFFDDKE